MTGCFTWLLVIAAIIFLMITMIRWFEQTADAFDAREWNRLLVLILMPFSAWLFPSRVSSGRPTAVPHHNPVMGMGSAPKPRSPDPTDTPPPGTPKEFLGMPVIPKKKPGSATGVDPDKIARLKQKMRDQGMIPDDDSE